MEGRQECNIYAFLLRIKYEVFVIYYFVQLLGQFYVLGYFDFIRVIEKGQGIYLRI